MTPEDFGVASAKIETILGGDAAENAKIIVNGKQIKRKPKLAEADRLVLAASMKKLKLKPGENKVVVEIDGIRSSPYTIVL